MFPLPTSFTVCVVTVEMERVPKVSLLPVPLSVIVRLPVVMLVPFAKLRSFVPPKVKLPPQVTALAVLSVIAPPLLLSMVLPVLRVRAPPPPRAPTLFRCSAPAVSVVVPV